MILQIIGVLPFSDPQLITVIIITGKHLCVALETTILALLLLLLLSTTVETKDPP